MPRRYHCRRNASSGPECAFHQGSALQPVGDIAAFETYRKLKIFKRHSKQLLECRERTVPRTECAMVSAHKRHDVWRHGFVRYALMRPRRRRDVRVKLTGCGSCSTCNSQCYSGRLTCSRSTIDPGKPQCSAAQAHIMTKANPMARRGASSHKRQHKMSPV